MKKDKIRLYSLILILTILIIRFIYSKTLVEFVYVSPNVNTSVLPYISKTINQLNLALDYSVKSSNCDGSKVKIIYKNAYGSGFLKHNPIPNDLDYAVGINLGKYLYDGKNAQEVAKKIESKMSDFEVSFYVYSNNSDENLFSNYNLMSSIIAMDKAKAPKINSMAFGIDKIFENKDYIFHTVKDIEDKEKIKYPFLLKSNEILAESYSPIMLFSPDLKYSKHSPKYLKEITLVLDFFADIEDTRTKQTKHVEIVSESFVGQKFQLSRRFFVPIVFVNESSARYLKTLNYLSDDKEYIEHRLLNFRRHLQEFENLNIMKDRPVKMLKRILQCAELIEPALDKQVKENLYSRIAQDLENKDVQLANDYQNALGNLIQITTMKELYKSADDKGQIQQLISAMRTELNQLLKSKEVNQQDVIALVEFQKNIEREYSEVKTENDLANFNGHLLMQMEKYNPKLLNIFKSCIKNENELISYIRMFNDIYTKAGFRKINLYWMNDTTIGILKDDLSGIKPSEIKQMALQNDLPKVNYEIISKHQVPKMTVRYSVWIRFNPTKEEEANWKKLQQQLLDDKKNFRIKRRLIPKSIF